MQSLPSPKTSGDIVTWGHLPGGSLAYQLALTLQKASHFTLIVTPDTLTASQLSEIIAFFNQTTIPEFPDWETLPYDVFSPHQDIIASRIKTLTNLLMGQINVLITPVTTLMQTIADLDYIANAAFQLKRGEVFNFEKMRTQLQQRGYYAVNQVMAHGEYAIRGAMMDIFPAGSDMPYRIELFDNEVESIRTFDPETQLTIEKINVVSLLPAREFPLDDESIKRFREAWRNAFSGNPMDCPIYESISEGIAPQGIEYYLPLFFDKKTTLFDYLPAQTQIIRVENCQENAEKFWQDVNARFQSRSGDRTRPLLPPNQLFLTPNEILEKLKFFPQLILKKASIEVKHTGHCNLEQYASIPDISVNHRVADPLVKLKQFISSHSHKIILSAETAGRKQSIIDLLQQHHCLIFSVHTLDEAFSATEKTCLLVSPLTAGFTDEKQHFSIITEAELFGEHVFQTRQKKAKQIDTDIAIRNLAELQIGAPVVHIEHGVGRFAGLQTIDAGGFVQEYLTLEFAGNDKLYVPVANLHLIGRYSGMNPDHVPLHKLGQGQWSKAKQKAFEKIRDVAAELLALYAKREMKQGFGFPFSPKEYEQFSSGFPFEETPDQARAITDVLKDMQKPKPMDRLICGDVGFGKTEVAMRAAFVAVTGGKQVAVLVPTTLLCEQHYQNFKDRFAEWPVNIASLSRFKTAKQQKTIVDELATGKVDIIIGTHKLLESTIQFKNLGLLVIDEEHRFGVHQKEKIKAYRAEVDILTLTATPIPRTLNMSLSGIRELSLIATPPAKRLSVKTFVHQRNHTIIQEAILREILRGGQVYYLHNKVDTIQNVAAEIYKLIPEAKVGVAHGQMRERELERIISDFYHQRFNVLVCTTIIETGIDIPTANTMIIDDADHFGLAQLHQLRGRVGRSHHQAYAYLFIPSESKITKDAEKRLEAIAAYDDLGVGFILANHDLEIRGAGELLGDEQSGNIQEIGFTLYMELLERTVKSLKSGEQVSLTEIEQTQTEIDLKISALIPDDYLPDIHQRLILYKRLANANTKEALDDLKIEMIDRFGLLPEPTKALFQLHGLKQKAQGLGIKKIDGGNLGGIIEFSRKTHVEPAKIIELIQTRSSQFKLETGQRLRYSAKGETSQERLEVLEKILTLLHA